mmetsp:Transcript_7237/g.20114  ORF Transcript_7237/g.20114 Transcript_7237/m.20114 type:complete len:300 (+) Transcript_7237:149-1048(+)
MSTSATTSSTSSSAATSKPRRRLIRPHPTIAVAEEMNPSRRSNMEDVHVCLQPGDDDDAWDSHEYALTAVYDGHGGRDIVDYLERHLSKNLAQELAHDDAADVGTRIERAFLLTDIQSRRANLMTSGATVVMCLVKRASADPGAEVTIHAANCGDARAVLSCTVDENGAACASRATRLTFDHRADDDGEELRIKAAGGFILNKRVLGILAVARSMGDHGLKEYVIAKPYVSETTLTKAEGQFIIVACDGLWDVMDDQLAVDMVREIAATDSKDAVADVLVQEAVKRGSTDNITAIVAWL